MRSSKKTAPSASQQDVINVDSSPKFRLFLKNREIQEVKQLLNHVLHMPGQQRSAWIEQYGDFVNQAFDALVDDSNFVLDELPYDEDTLEMSHELVTSLRDALQLMEGILSDQPQLVS